MRYLAEKVASVALSTFESLPQKCKPRSLPDGGREWTPMAAVVLAEGADNPRWTCVSLATGTKCLASSALPRCHGSVLHDSHAEVLASRGFNYWLLAEIQEVLEDPAYDSPFLEFIKESGAAHQPVSESKKDAPCRLKSTVSIHFFTTEAPCGDASMELLMNSMPRGGATPWSVEEDSVATLQGRGHFSLLGHVRRKPARADAEPSLSKSCTDKLSLKQFTSIISFPADLFIQRTPNTFIQTLVVYSSQYNPTGYHRAFAPSGRLLSSSHLGHFFNVEPLPAGFPSFPFGKDDLRPKMANQDRFKTSNLSALWIKHSGGKGGDILEILINGVKQGYKQWDQRPGKASVVSRRRLWEQAIKLVNAFPQDQRLQDGSAPPTTERFSQIFQTLSMKTYRAAKSTGLRSSYLGLKEHVTMSLGNWSHNQGDDEWGLG